MRSVLACFIGLAALTLPAAARAEPPRHAFQVDYVRRKGALVCPADGAAILQRELSDVMHYDPVKPDAPQTASAIFDRDEKGKLTGVAIMRDSAGKELWRTDLISTVSPCRVLVQSVALSIVAMLPDLKEPEPPPKPPEPPPKPQPCPVQEPPPSHPAPVVKPRNFEVYGGVDVIGSFGVTLTPSLGVGGVVGLRLREPALFFELGGRLTGTVVRSDLPVSKSSTAAVNSSLSAGTLTACGSASRLFFCAVAGLGSVSLLSAPGLPVPARSSPFGIVGVGIGFEHALVRQIRLRYLAELAMLLGSAELRSNAERVAWTKPPGMGSAGIGITFGLW